MTLGRTHSIALSGLSGTLVRVEVDITSGLPAFTMTGLPDTACRQSIDRIRAAAANSGLAIPKQRITVNLSPASLPKSGSGFDVAIAVAVLVAEGTVPADAVHDVVLLGELGLDGSIRPVRGVLPAVLAASRYVLRRVVVPAANVREAALVPGVQAIAAGSLRELVARLVPDRHEGPDETQAFVATADPEPVDTDEPAPAHPASPTRDLTEVVGQDEARLALEIAAAGGHHLVMIGPPGAGKTLLAECLPSILPPLSDQEALEVTAIHSLLGQLPSDTLVRQAPFVAPHHTATTAALVGGGSGQVRPGLISQAHRGVLFLDEAAEFRAETLQALRQPLECGRVVVARANASVSYPARFQLLLAANPCPCGKGHGKGIGCECTPRATRDYRGRLAGPLLDRVDLQLAVQPVSRTALAQANPCTSATVADRVKVARARQSERWARTPWSVNAEVAGSRLRSGTWRLPSATTADLDRALDRGALTLRGYDRVLRVAWTAADLTGSDRPDRDHVGLALTLRCESGLAG